MGDTSTTTSAHHQALGQRSPHCRVPAAASIPILREIPSAVPQSQGGMGTPGVKILSKGDGGGEGPAMEMTSLWCHDGDIFLKGSEWGSGDPSSPL